MKVRWSSTYVMLCRAESRRAAINEFIVELGANETNPGKRLKITALRLHDDEWTRVRLFCNLLQVRALHIYFTNIPMTCILPTGNSTPTMPNKPSLRPPGQPFNILFPPSKGFMRCGRRRRPRSVTQASPRHLMLGWRSSTHTTSGAPSRMRILWPWVMYHTLPIHSSLTIVL
jgi:hypothetical protein